MIFYFYHQYEPYTTGMNTAATYQELHARTFSPNICIDSILDTDRPPAGKTYAAKKSRLADMAIDFSLSENFCLCWSEIAEIQAYFEKYGRRYGLLKEFRENAIC